MEPTTSDADLKVVIVEDNVALADIYKTRLDALGYICFTAYDGREALEVIEKNQPNLVLLDLMVPKVAGDEILRTMRAHDWGKHIKVLVISNLNEADAPVGLRDFGIEGYVVKANLSNDDLDHMVDMILKPTGQTEDVSALDTPPPEGSSPSGLSPLLPQPPAPEPSTPPANSLSIPVTEVVDAPAPAATIMPAAPAPEPVASPSAEPSTPPEGAQTPPRPAAFASDLHGPVTTGAPDSAQQVVAVPAAMPTAPLIESEPSAAAASFVPDATPAEPAAPAMPAFPPTSEMPPAAPASPTPAPAA